ncbi:MAG: type II toxin-antitoxin system RelE family toxin [Microcoleaceae cyanobacterium]
MSQYKIYIVPDTFQTIKALPGNVRQRIRTVISNLADEPRPGSSKALDVPDDTRELRRIRLDKWRIIYVIAEFDRAIDVLAVRQRPPYDYEDLQELIETPD